jgi:hypothetical protein
MLIFKSLCLEINKSILNSTLKYPFQFMQQQPNKNSRKIKLFCLGFEKDHTWFKNLGERTLFQMSTFFWTPLRKCSAKPIFESTAQIFSANVTKPSQILTVIDL